MNYLKSNISENNFEQCVKCTICTDYCPVTAVNPEYPGPKQAGPDGERYRLKKPSFYDEALKYCLNCKRCEVACPSNVKIGDIIQTARIKYSKKSPALRDIILANTDFVGSITTKMTP
ncbi:MAG: 4Fe-4S dicluster domain-containing protein, partial [Muribaculaceae bacterium]|nr:4Fe-4S dicluster domain-containing protein [Muribaculaceae bacterium]